MKRFVTIWFMILFFENLSTYCQHTDTFAVINSSKIYYHKKGYGKPAIIFVSGLGEDHNTWQMVQDSISKISLTLSYDRAGLGKSEYKGEKKDVFSLAQELYKLTNAIHISKPFILIGHSLGCQIVKEYTVLYPEDVNGIIFLDPGYNEEKLKRSIPDSVWKEREQALKKYLPEFNSAQQEELKNANRSSAISDQIKTLPKIPIVLFTATHINPDFPGSVTELRVKQETHRLWLQSLPWAQHFEVKESRHYIQNEAPDVVIDAVYKMIREVSK